jgi:ribonuclease HII
MDWLYYEKLYSDDNKKIICGVDEAGRGPLAGPVYAAAVVLPPNVVIDGVNDSKKLSEKKREYLYDIIKKKATCYHVSSASVEEVDSLNILNATFLAMKRAVDGLEIQPDFALIDGNMCPELSICSKAIIKGDGLSESIACASILAKVTRDRLMVEESERYPEYQFAKHKGYGTKLHIDMIKNYGPSPIHRKTFLKRILKYEQC